MHLTGIEWTTFASNPLKFLRKSDGEVVWACVKSSPGCANCYAQELALRYDRGKLFNARNMEELEPFMDEKELHRMLTQKVIKGHQVAGSMCFVCDMTDLFGEWVPFELIDKLFAVFALRQDVTWQVLTKWPERMAEYFDRGPHASNQMQAVDPQRGVWSWPGWPLPNVWLGCSVENQEQADKRIPHLLKCPAAVRFLSCEPLLGPIDLAKLYGNCGYYCDPEVGHVDHQREPADWVIVGGESGPNARPMHDNWVREIRDQCESACVPFFFKQWGAWYPQRSEADYDDRRDYNGMPSDGEGFFGGKTNGRCYAMIHKGIRRLFTRAGKKGAGRELDGRTWDEFPVIERATS